MKSFRAVCISALLFAVPAIGQSPDFEPRHVFPKPDVVAKPAVPNGRIIVKFKDEVQARLRAGTVKSTVGSNLQQVHDLAKDMDLTFSPLFGDKSDMALRLVEIRAAAYSGKEQPDLAGMMYVDGPQEQLDQIVARLNAMNVVEFVEYDQEYTTNLGGMDPSCGMNTANNCFDASANMGPYCDDMICCQLICQIRPFCCDDNGGQWDAVCADLANLFCPCDPPCFGTPPDRCDAPILNGGCFDAHQGAGCNQASCCNTVCMAQPDCCTSVWDDLCVNAAFELCPINDPGPTPDFSETNPDPTMRKQQYRTAAPSDEFFNTYGYTGHGYDMQGLWNLGQYLADNGIGEENMSHGLGRRIAIIEFGADVPTSIASGHALNSPGHEDLSQVICEPGQTPFFIDAGALQASHGTACLGIAVAEDNGFGVTGIARHAQGYFFPTTSFEDGGRTQAAILSCMEMFEPGDVMSFSFGPAGACGTLVSSPANWTLIRVASDIGITSCIAAGNSCCNLDNGITFEGQEDSGAIIVGACWPGAVTQIPGDSRFCRLGFSNHCQECDHPQNLIHCAAWGVWTATTGYGNLFGVAGDRNRRYTDDFSGTSSACPQVAALVACLQGVAVQFFGVPFAPEQIRSSLVMAAQCSTFDPPGSPQMPPCGGDFDPSSPTNSIVGYPLTIDSAAAIFAQSFFDDAPSVRTITLVWGTHLMGNVFSIKGNDNNLYGIESDRRTGSNASAPGGQFITYLGSGLITDVIVEAESNNPQPTNTATINGTLLLQASGPVILIIEFFNWDTGKFDRVGFAMLASGVNAFGALQGNLFQTQGAYVDRNSGRMQARLWTLGFTNNQKYRVFYDLIDLRASNDPGPNPGGGVGNGAG